jgi:hypothetical protein
MNLRFIEENSGLRQLTDRDRDATDLTYDFDFAKRTHTRPHDAASGGR